MSPLNDRQGLRMFNARATLVALFILGRPAFADPAQQDQPPLQAPPPVKTNVSAVAAAEKRSETTVIQVAPAGEEKVAARDEESHTPVVIRTGEVVGTTKAVASSHAGVQTQVESPALRSQKSVGEPPPVVIRALGAALPKIRACVAGGRKALSFTLLIDAAGKPAPTFAPAAATETESQCVSRVLAVIKVRGARGSSSEVVLPL